MAGAGAKADDDRRQAEAAGISKRGNVYLRKMLIHGARAALPTLSKERDAAGRVAARPARAGAYEHRRGGARRQAGADRLGRAAERQGFDMRAATVS